MKRLILASASPRRKELLENEGFSFEVICADINEKSIESKYTEPERVVTELARAKALAVYNSNRDALVLGADTVVVHKGKILGKPKDSEKAHIMLSSLSNEEHSVYTGVALIDRDEQRVFFVQTRVLFNELTDRQINEYIKSGSPFDKAGGYGIQDSNFVKEIKGDYDNVVGLPAKRIAPIIKDILEK